MKKLLLTTALAGATLVASNAIAQTTVTGNLDIGYKMFGAKGGTANTQSMNGFGRESQINIQNKGKLNNGMDYAAGFSIEHDGGETTTRESFNENTFIDIISGNTTLTISQDHIQSSHRTAANFVGLIAEDLTNTSGNGATADIFMDTVGANPYAAYGVGIVQAVPGIASFSALYVPSNISAATAGVDEDSALDNDAESGYEIGFLGSLGVKGLSAHAFYNHSDRTDVSTSLRDTKGTNIGASYNFGQITAGYNYKKAEAGTTTKDIKQDEFGLAYAVSPNLTIGANYTKTKDDSKTAPVDAESKSIAVGYNLGAVALTAQVAKVENYTGVGATTDDDADVVYLRASTKF
jgi:hypothetical protein